MNVGDEEYNRTMIQWAWLRRLAEHNSLSFDEAVRLQTLHAALWEPEVRFLQELEDKKGKQE